MISCAIGRVSPREGGNEPRGAPLYGLVGRLAICRQVGHCLNGGGSLAYQSARVINRHWFHLELSHRDAGGDERIAEVAGDVFVM